MPKDRKGHPASRSLKDRFRYWFDNHIARGSLSLIRILIVASVVFAVLVAALIVLFRFNEKGEVASVVWDSIATVINAEVPSFEDGSPGYLALMSVTAIAGVLFTSVLIGIITSAIEERILELKKGNSLVLEQGHIVVLGFYPGEYALLRQLILAAGGKPACVVLAGSMDREDMERALDENLTTPKNFKIVCRTADITDPASLEKCSIETCRTVIVSPTDDDVTTKAVLAVSVLLREKGVSNIQVNAILSKSQHCFPQSLTEAHNLSVLHTNDILAKMIAHSCTQTGLSETFREVFNFEGSEFYLIDLPEVAGETFDSVMARINYAVPSGVFRDRRMILNPPADLVIQDGDKLLVFAEESDSFRLEERWALAEMDSDTVQIVTAEDRSDTVIIGHSETLPLILQELPENVSHVYLAGAEISEEAQQPLDQISRSRGLAIHMLDLDIRAENALLELARLAEHIVILNDHEKEPDDADMEVIFLLLNFRDLRDRYQLHFNITVEMQRERNQKLVGGGDHTDFLVASNMSSLILAQLAESPRLIDVFREILSNQGNELYLKNAAQIHLTGTHTVRELRRLVLRSGYTFLGYVDAQRQSHFNLPLDDEIALGPEDDVIVLGEN